jgi:hypothetical protein
MPDQALNHPGGIDVGYPNRTHRHPEDEGLSFLDTDEGKGWLANRADDLCKGEDAVWYVRRGLHRCEREGVTYGELRERVIHHPNYAERWEALQERWFDAALRDDALAQFDARVDLRNLAREAALEMLAKWADAYAEHRDNS